MMNLTNAFYDEKEMQDIMKDFYPSQEKDNQSISLTYLFYHNSMYKNV